MTNDPRPRLVPPALLGFLLAVCGGAIAWLQATDGVGDRGLNNAISYILALVLLGAYLVWFVGFSGQRAVLRLGVLTMLVLVGLALFTLVRLEGWTGALIPVARWVWEEPVDRTVVAEAGGREPSVPPDLAAAAPEDFPGFLGARRDGALPDVHLAAWDELAPELIWRRPIGSGWSGFAVVAGVAITQEEADGSQHVVALDVDTGHELWRHSWAGTFDHPMGGPGPRATPTVAGGRVFAQGPRGRLVALDGADGALVWSQDLRALFEIPDAFEADALAYGRSSSPLVVGDVVVVAVGGDPDVHQAGLAGFAAADGTLLWEGPPRAVSHASPMRATLDGVEQLLAVNEASVSGHAPADGTLLWEVPWPGSTSGDANTSQPVVVGDRGLLLSKGYGQGARLLDVARAGDGWHVTERWGARRSLRTKMTSAVVRAGHAFALSDGMLECVALADGRRVWKEGRYGHGQLLLVGEHLLVLTEEGELVLVPATAADEGRSVGRFPVLAGKTWNTFAVYGDRALVRNAQEAAAVRLPLAGPDGAAAPAR